MKRVVVLGAAGSGKSTLARWIGEWTGLPVKHLDQLHWLPHWTPRPHAERIAMVQALEQEECWIIEGGISATYATRLARADVVIWLDLPIVLRLWRVMARSWRYRGQVRPDLSGNCPERFDRETWRFLVWMWNYRNISRDKILASLGTDGGCTPLHHLKSRSDVTEFMRGFEAERR